MPYQVRCRGCRSKLRIGDSLFERPAQCPKCERKFVFHLAKANGATSAAEVEAAEDLALASLLEDDAEDAPPPPKKASAPRPVMGAAEFSKAMEDAPAPPPPMTRPVPMPPKPLPKKPVTKEPGEGLPTGIKVLIGGGVGLIALILVAWFLFGGSGLGTVTGIVTFEGQPLAGAAITFIGDDATGSFNGQSGSDGKYKVYGATGSGIPAGNYKVTVTKYVGKGGKTTEEEGAEADPESGRLRNMIHDAYAQPEITPLKFEVKRGTNTIDIKVSKQPP